MYTTVSNPLLPSNTKSTPPRRSLSKSMAQKWSGSRMGQMITSTKRVVPSQSHTNLNHHHDTKHISTTASPLSKKNLSSFLPKAKGKEDNNATAERSSKSKVAVLLPETESAHNHHHHASYQGPCVYYNGDVDTLAEFPQDRLVWLLQPSAVEAHLPKWTSPHSVTLKNLHVVDHSSSYRITNNPMAMLYLRVLDVVKSTSTKASSFYCKVQIHDQIYNGVPTPCVKYEKQSSQAEIDEVYLFDLDHPTTVTFKLYMKTKMPFLKGGRRRSTEICLGQKEYHLNLRPVEKQVNRVAFQHGQDTYQVMLIHGLFMNDRAQSVVANQLLHSDFLTVYCRGGKIPRWHRYWGVLRATHLALYDFEYKESKPAQVVLPFHMLEKVFHPSNTDDDEQMIDVGRLGLALQFTPYHRHINSSSAVDDNENRMYALPDDVTSSHEWKNSFSYCASLVKEFRATSCKAYDNTILIPAKYLW